MIIICGSLMRTRDKPMEIRQLRYFLSTLRHGSLVAAAREHFITQPAISIQLKKLQEEVGERLYTRRQRRVVATRAGEVVAGHASEIIDRVDALTRSVQGLKGGDVGRLAVGNIDAASIYVLPDVFRHFREDYPKVDIRVTVADSDTLINALEGGSIELAIVTLPIAGEHFEVVPFYKDEMVVVTHAEHELVTSQTTGRRALQILADGGLITYPADSMTRRLIDRVFLDNGLTVRAAMEMSTPEAIKRLTESGLGASILPLHVVASEVKAGSLRVVPTGRISFYRNLGVVYAARDALSPPARNFLNLLTRQFKLRGRMDK